MDDNKGKIDITPEEVWEMAKDIFDANGGMSSLEIEEAFDTRNRKDIYYANLDEVTSSYRMWKEKAALNVGDIVDVYMATKMDTVRGLVLNVCNDNEAKALVYMNTSTYILDINRKSIHKTGKHIDLEKLVNE